MSKEAMKDRLMKYADDMCKEAEGIERSFRDILLSFGVLSEYIAQNIEILSAIDPELFESELARLDESKFLSMRTGSDMAELFRFVEGLSHSLRVYCGLIEDAVLPMSPTEPIHFD